jgi:hypothetical protein
MNTIENTNASPRSSPTNRLFVRRLETSDTFSCDAAFYRKWKINNLTCGGHDLDVEKAVASATCVTYEGQWVPSGRYVLSSVPVCLSSCFFPSCVRNDWDYATSETSLGIGSAVYQGVNFSSWLTSAMETNLSKRRISLTSLSMQVNRSCVSNDADCTCAVPPGTEPVAVLPNGTIRYKKNPVPLLHDCIQLCIDLNRAIDRFDR